MIDFNKVWESEEVRALDVLGHDNKVKRELEDKLTIEVSAENWSKMFNLAEGYKPCGPDWKPFSNKVVARFIRVNEEGK